MKYKNEPDTRGMPCLRSQFYDEFSIGISCRVGVGLQGGDWLVMLYSLSVDQMNSLTFSVHEDE
ncbi:hypothetical protein E2C01_043566 [Portunus trituberculatus]|uniref:Uncharacterized protein n=1 Tax=Portunus trituberculatus TaxID=210409 RepID=A0A5B7FZX5_PORTR|nr:hypothetical protein [Portunus trituberculatus]